MSKYIKDILGLNRYIVVGLCNDQIVMWYTYPSQTLKKAKRNTADFNRSIGQLNNNITEYKVVPYDGSYRRGDHQFNGLV